MILSLPARGAWIEITAERQEDIPTPGRSPHGERRANLARCNGKLYNITRIDGLRVQRELGAVLYFQKMKSRKPDKILKNLPNRAILLAADYSHAQEGYSYDLQL